MRKPKKKTGRPSGAPVGNKNALKHGFYAKNFTTAEKHQLDDVEVDVITSQIKLLEISIARLAAILEIKVEKYFNMAGDEIIRDHYLHQLNSMTVMSLAVGTHYRTTLLASGKLGEADIAIMDAIKQTQIDMGIRDE